MLDTLAVANYRSLRELVVPLRRCTVVTGPNGSGKSSVYRALRLLADMARDGAVNALARLKERGPADLSLLELLKRDGQTAVQGQRLLDQPAWHWPDRH